MICLRSWSVFISVSYTHLHERKVELAFEDQRWWDLRRWRTAVDAITRNFSGIYTFYDVKTGKFRIELNENAMGGVPSVFKEEHYYFPITPGRICLLYTSRCV